MAPSWRDGLLLRLNAMALGVGLIVVGLALALRHGARSVTPVAGKILIGNIRGRVTLENLRCAAKDRGIWSDDAIVVVMERAIHQDVRELGMPTIEPAGLKVPLVPWTRRVLGPALRLACAVLPVAMSPTSDARAVALAAECFRQARSALGQWRLAFNLCCRSVVDSTEGSPLHIVKAMVFRKFGARTVRWPGSAMDYWSPVNSHLGYDIYLSSGHYIGETFGATWNPSCLNVAVGQQQFDRRITRGQNVAPRYRDQIERRIAAGQRMLVFFGGQMVEGIRPVGLDPLAVALRAVGVRDDWFLVVKPKRTREILDLAADDPRFAGIRDRDDVMVIDYPVAYEEVLPLAWLIDRLTLATGDPSTVQYEVLCGDKRFLTYYPVVTPTRFRRTMVEAGFLNPEIGSFEQALGRALDDPNYPEQIPALAHDFDPFGDDDALGRIVELLLDPDLAKAGGKLVAGTSATAATASSLRGMMQTSRMGRDTTRKWT